MIGKVLKGKQRWMKVVLHDIVKSRLTFLQRQCMITSLLCRTSNHKWTLRAFQPSELSIQLYTHSNPRNLASIWVVQSEAKILHEMPRVKRVFLHSTPKKNKEILCSLWLTQWIHLIRHNSKWSASSSLNVVMWLRQTKFKGRGSRVNHGMQTCLYLCLSKRKRWISLEERQAIISLVRRLRDQRKMSPKASQTSAKAGIHLLINLAFSLSCDRQVEVDTTPQWVMI